MGGVTVVVVGLVLVGFCFNRYLNYKEKQNKQTNEGENK